MIKNFDQILSDLREKKYESVYFLSGEEPYYVDAVSDFIEANVLNENEKAFNLTLYYGKEVSADIIIETSMRFPMMAEKNIVIVKEAQAINNLDWLLSYLNNCGDSSILVICYKYKKLDKRTKLWTALSQSKDCCVLDSSKMKEGQLSKWVEDYMKDKGFKITSKASYLLTEYLGNDLSKIANELNKLFIIKKESPYIDTDDIEKHVGISKDYNIFELQRALVNRQADKITMIFNHIAANPKTHPPQLVSGALFSFFSKLIVFEQNRRQPQQVFGKLGIRFPAEYETAVRNYGGRIEQILLLIQEYDLRSKGIGSRNVSDAELLKELCFKILLL